ncbi:MAG: 13E12 repeat family protein [Actinomycetota bacterium]|nr:13E12 repeat family protein [Actinomycetota bacterium]
MTTGFAERIGHPVTSAVARIRADLDSVADLGAWSLGSVETAAALQELGRARGQLAELELRLVHHADRVGLHTEVGAADTLAWWANTTRQTKPDAKRRVLLAASLDYDHEPVRDAMAEGRLAEDQAAVIVHAADALPVELVEIEVRREAERQLIELAADHDAKALRVLGKRILDIVAPEIGEEHERRLLEREEESAREACRLRLTDDGHGQCHLRGVVPAQVGAMLKKALLAIAAPRHQASSGRLGERVVGPARLGRPLCEYVERCPAERLPQAGGLAATVVVTMTLESLLGRDTVATLGTGERISADEARRIACETGVIPAVLGGRSEVLDLGRARRFHTGGSASPSPCATRPAPSRAATGRRACATSTTTSHGAVAGRPTRRPVACCALATTRWRTTPSTRCDRSRTGGSCSVGPELGWLVPTRFPVRSEVRELGGSCDGGTNG